MIHILLVILSLGLLSCDRSTVEPDARPVAQATQSSDPDPTAPAAPAPSVPAPAATWTRLLAEHGAGLAGVTLAETKSAVFNATNGDLVVMFDWPHHMGKDRVMRPSKGIDYRALSAKLDAESVGGVPREFMMLCGENHGGDFEVGGARFGIYVSGGCHHVRIFGATPDAVRLLLGEEFVSMLDDCKARVIQACRTSDVLRIQFDQPLSAASARLKDAGGTKLAPDGEDGWMRGEPSSYAADKEFERVAYAGQVVACVAEMPELSAPAQCGLSGVTHRVDDPCRDSGSCKEKGLCAMVDEDCQATAQVHCDKSRGCFQQGRCTLIDGACAASAQGCEAWQMCAMQGRCTLAKDRCVAADDDCRDLEMCRRSGACTAIDGKCNAGSDADCAQSEACTERGACGFRKGRCTQVTEANCRLAPGCEQHGSCLLAKGGAGCAHCWVSDPKWPKDQWTWKGGRCKKVR